MNKVILQLWEESDRYLGVNPGGCSLHKDESSLKEYLNSIYSNRGDDVPDSYERAFSNPVIVDVVENIHNIVQNSGSVRLQQYEMNNLLNLKEIILEND